LVALVASTPTSSEREREPAVRTTFEPGEGIDWTRTDDRFSLGIGLLAQLLYTIDHDVPADDTSQSFQIRRARVIFDGHVFGPHNRFYVQLAVSPRDLEVQDGRPTRTPIFDWYAEFDHIPESLVDAARGSDPGDRAPRD